MAVFDIIMAQLNTLVGDFDGNVSKILASVGRAEAHYDRPVVVFPELTLCGYPPEDLLLRPSMHRRVDAALARLCTGVADSYAVVGYPRLIDGRLYNVAGVIHAGELIAEYAKQCLPNYQVFDEKRYFAAGTQPVLVDIHGVPVGLSICEDIWEAEPCQKAKAAGAALILNLNSSPFHRGKPDERQQLVAQRARENQLPIVYVNQVGGQDELVFDGGSFAVSADGTQVAAAPHYLEGEFRVAVEMNNGEARLLPGELADPLDPLDSIYQALVLGVRDYVDKKSPAHPHRAPVPRVGGGRPA